MQLTNKSKRSPGLLRRLFRSGSAKRLKSKVGFNERRFESSLAESQARFEACEERDRQLESLLQNSTARFEANEERHRQIETLVRNLDARFTGHLPAFLNAVSSVAAFGHQLGQLRNDVGGLANIMAPLDYSSSKVKRAIDHIAEISEKLAKYENNINDLAYQLANSEANLSNLNAQAESLTKINSGHSKSIHQLWERIEFIRFETLHEMRYSQPKALADIKTAPARIANQDKLTRMAQDGLRINIGCGHIALDGYINVDMRELPGVDVVCEVTNLPFEKMSLIEMHSAHLIEHFPMEQLRRSLLPFWFGLIRPGGIFRAIVPDGEAMLNEFSKGDYSFEEFRDVLFGGQEYEGDFHFNLLTPDSFTHLLQEAGFVDISIPVRARRNGKCFEFEISALKP